LYSATLLDLAIGLWKKARTPGLACFVTRAKYGISFLITASSDSHLAGHGNDQGEFSGSHRRVAFGVRGYWFDGIDHCLGIEDKCVVMGKQIEVLGGTIMAGKKLNDAPGVDGGVDWRTD
jgi:hypothetical protein